MHEGFPYYTVGQRKGLGVALGKPAYVLRLNAEKNTVVLGDAEQLNVEGMLVSQAQFVGEDDMNSGELSVRIRYRSRPIGCTIQKVKNLFADATTEELLLVRFKEKASAVTPGQSAVFYIGDRMVGGAYICSQKGLQAYLQE
jgi:tRNA-specific 2-thiouridylase